jgi:E-phenylitaconyl-CoA hydratase
LNAAWLRFRDDTEAWVAILTGAGRAFCAGADVREGGSTGTFAGTFWEKPTINSFESGLELFKPTIAAINGPCLGYGVTAVVTVQVVKTGLTPLAPSDRLREAETEPRHPAGRLHTRR